jgi:hypothetical protein
MYLDKPMRDHVLLQAFARVNRPYVDANGVQKRVGLVIDFVGVLRELKKALQFDSSDVSGVIEDLDLLLKDFLDKIDKAKTEYLEISGEGSAETLAVQLGRHGITVNCIHPGTTRTERTPSLLSARATQLGVSPEDAERHDFAPDSPRGNAICRMVDASEIAFVAVFLASDKASPLKGKSLILHPRYTHGSHPPARAGCQASHFA